jgi:hypothetical protein
MWEIEVTDQFRDWYGVVTDDDAQAINDAVDVLQQQGPSLGRPLVDTLEHSRHAHMKELRPLSTSIRILFAFDPRRMAILLLGGDKQGEWERWYRVNIPRADDLYDAHLAALKKEGSP